MWISRRLLVVSSLAALVLAGCGGGDDGDSTAAAPVETTEATTALSKEELIAQGDGICAEVNAAVGTVGSTSAAAESQASQVAGLYGGMVERLKGLGAPSDDSAGYAEFIAAADALSQAEENVELASEREDAEALTGAETEASSALTSFQSAAATFGLEECAEAPAPPVASGAGGEATGEEATGGLEEGEFEEVAPEEEVEVAPEEAPPVEEESAGGGAGVGGGTEGGGSGTGGGSSGGVGPG